MVTRYIRGRLCLHKACNGSVSNNPVRLEGQGCQTRNPTRKSGGIEGSLWFLFSGFWFHVWHAKFGLPSRILILTWPHEVSLAGKLCPMLDNSCIFLSSLNKNLELETYACYSGFVNMTELEIILIGVCADWNCSRLHSLLWCPNGWDGEAHFRAQSGQSWNLDPWNAICLHSLFLNGSANCFDWESCSNPVRKGISDMHDLSGTEVKECITSCYSIKPISVLNRVGWMTILRL